MLSMLYTPALQVDRAVKAWNYLPDAVILDLEDSISNERKKEARACAASTLSEVKMPWYVRINGLNSDLWLADLEAILHDNLQGILIPKVEDVNLLKEMDEIVAKYEKESGRKNMIRFMPSIETVLGFDRLREIIHSSIRIDSITLAEGDFSLDLGIEWDSTSPTIVAAKTKIVIESRLAQLNAPHDGVYPRLHDESGLYENCVFAKKIGFGCKHCIHPEQLSVVHKVFAPNQALIERANRIVEEYEAALKVGTGAIQINGEFVDYPVYYRALQLIAR